MDVKRFITKEDFLSLKSWPEGGTYLGFRVYARMGSYEDSLKQLSMIGKVDKTGEGVIDKVFFFEVFRSPVEEIYSIDVDERYPLMLEVVCAYIVDKYRFISNDECRKEVVLTLAKIKLKEKSEKEDEDNNSLV